MQFPFDVLLLYMLSHLKSQSSGKQFGLGSSQFTAPDTKKLMHY